MKQKNNKKKYNNKYQLGSYVEAGTKGSQLAGGIQSGGQLATMVGGAIGGNAGSIISGIGSGAAAGAALGPIGAGVGAAIGLGGALLGNAKQKRMLAQQRKDQYNTMITGYNDTFNNSLDTDNENPYGTEVFADGGQVRPGYNKFRSKLPKNLQSTKDYDLQGYYNKYGDRGTSANGHLTDEFKLPNHPTFSNESQYFNNNTMMKAGFWSPNDVYIPFDQNRPSYDEKNNKYIPFTSYEKASGKFKTGGEVTNNTINIEEGEIQIDPATGKILREYIGMNPETESLYKPHSKGKDPKGNFVLAEPGTFIITKDMAKDYKDSVDGNDKIRRDTILQNIRNAKEKKEPSQKMAAGSFVDPTNPYNYNMELDKYMGLQPNPLVNIAPAYNQTNLSLQGQPSYGIAGGGNKVASTGQGNGIMNVLNTALNYAPALTNIGQGLFGKVEQTPNVGVINNPYTNQIINNMPKDVNLSPLVNRINRNQTNQFATIDQGSSSSAIARANKQSVFAGTQDKIGDLYFQQEQQNNQIRGQRSSLYNNLGQQSVQEQARAQQINLGINDQNSANRAAKSNLLGTGLSQLQQTYQNQRMNKTKASMDKYKVDLLRQMFPNLKYYGSQFGDDALSQLMGG